MKTSIVPELGDKIKAAAVKLAASADESIVIEGADNMVLAKMLSSAAREKLDAGMALYPYQHEGNEFLVCIDKRR